MLTYLRTILKWSPKIIGGVLAVKIKWSTHSPPGSILPLRGKNENRKLKNQKSRNKNEEIKKKIDGR